MQAPGKKTSSSFALSAWMVAWYHTPHPASISIMGRSPFALWYGGRSTRSPSCTLARVVALSLSHTPARPVRQRERHKHAAHRINYFCRQQTLNTEVGLPGLPDSQRQSLCSIMGYSEAVAAHSKPPCTAVGEPAGRRHPAAWRGAGPGLRV